MKRLKEQEEPRKLYFFEYLVKFARGKIDKSVLKQNDESNLIYGIELKKPQGESIIGLEFDDSDKLLELMGADENDIWFYNSLHSSYSSNFDFYDSDQLEEDFRDGYLIFNDLDENNIEDLKQIAKLLVNTKFNLEDRNFKQELGSKMMELFSDEVSEILNDYRIYKEDEMATTAKESISSEIESALKEKNFEVIRDYYRISTPAVNLIDEYFLVKDKKIDLEKLIEEIFSDNRIGGWDENRYEFHDYNNFDDIAFNREVSRSLTKILEKIGDDEKIKKYLEIYDKITSKFQLGHFYELPHDKKYSFLINSIDVDDLMISITLRNSETKQNKKLPKLTEEGFFKFIYNPQLFGLSDLFYQ